MKFMKAWENIVRDNQHLKITVAALLTATISLLIITASLALKDPTIIERGCFSKTPQLGEAKQTQIEYEEFLKQVLEFRFNTDKKVIEGFLSVDEKRNKEKEQKALSKNNLVQSILVRGFDLESSPIVVEIDRIYSIGKVRSALPIKVKVTLETKARTKTNPYGLILVKTEEIKPKKEKKNESR